MLPEINNPAPAPAAFFCGGGNASGSNSPVAPGRGLLEAAKLLATDPIASRSGLAAALEELASLNAPPADLTTWLCARLREKRPVAVLAYPDPVLPGLVMKCDEFAGIHLLKSPRVHPEVWNWRQADGGLPVFGVGQCHLGGLAFLVGHLKELGYSSVKWYNMREEPVVFLGGQACAPRTANNMNENVEYLMSIEGFELDAIEKRLCCDCEAAGGAAGALDVFYQISSSENEERSVALAPETTLPMRGAYDWLAKQAGAAVEYYRVPIADETAPEEKDFDQLVAELRGVDASSALVFNCQMGRGRTTTGMACAVIMCTAKGYEGSTAIAEPRDRVKGEFLSILELVALVDRVSGAGAGLRAKALADFAIGSCAHAQHMVEAIVACEASAAKAKDTDARNPKFWRTRGRNYLERYAYLILFAAYALANADTKYASNFTEWSHKHWQFKRVIKHMTME
eukprot:CAMPEP_0119295180 /NCGR_PEP_ID=MMETSP1329-20130426/49350_1 /TAXON_ID=114041 /ORGANISM="Genus nov. species nov., Strain RCC1024" /LENGTH=455 /DNA_ID=CAMNT_0007296091 /DNA_START=110 /DNA_END=1477 /DNA_ORIENTATION=+